MVEKIYNRFDGIITEYTHLKDNYYISKNSGIVIDLDKVSFSGKTSRNIIDLIEPGEIVYTDYGIGFFHHKINENEFLFDDREEFIEVKKSELKAILTREQFKNGCFEIGEKDE